MRNRVNLKKHFILRLFPFFKVIFKVCILFVRCIEPLVVLRLTEGTEFMPYVFQLLAALLEANPSATLPGHYEHLIAPIIAPAMWESKGNVPALVRLLSSIIPRGTESITNNNQIEPILGIFQKLVSSKANESYGFDLLEAVISNFPPYVISLLPSLETRKNRCLTSNRNRSVLEQYFVSILRIILTRLQNSKTENLSLRFVRFYHFISARDDKGYSADFFIQVAENVQSGYVALWFPSFLPY